MKKKRGKPGIGLKKKREATSRKRMKKGMAVICRDCYHQDQIPLNSFYSASQPRCAACGGGLDRVYQPGAEFQPPEKQEPKPKRWERQSTKQKKATSSSSGRTVPTTTGEAIRQKKYNFKPFS